ncbi:hypothetical protein [Actinobaculum massiliense]|uniref:hypothetical protein n=1 Tax=Actinobaculum massiliense TaxID=202789 RepID=UPI00071AF456|nr:hypothetical protein [Actinobaculum massiliense]
MAETNQPVEPETTPTPAEPEYTPPAGQTEFLKSLPNKLAGLDKRGLEEARALLLGEDARREAIEKQENARKQLEQVDQANQAGKNTPVDKLPLYAPGAVYAKGARVIYMGKPYTSQVDANVWAPDSLGNGGGQLWLADAETATSPDTGKKYPRWQAGIYATANQIYECDGKLYKVRLAHWTMDAWKPGLPGLDAIWTPYTENK